MNLDLFCSGIFYYLSYVGSWSFYRNKTFRSLLSTSQTLVLRAGFLTYPIGKWLKTRSWHFILLFTKRSDWAQIWSGASFCVTLGDLWTYFWNFNFFGQFWGPNVEILPIFSAKCQISYWETGFLKIFKCWGTNGDWHKIANKSPIFRAI